MTKAELKRIEVLEIKLADHIDRFNFRRESILDWQAASSRNTRFLQANLGRYSQRLEKMELVYDGVWLGIKMLGFLLALAAIFGLGMLAA